MRLVGPGNEARVAGELNEASVAGNEASVALK